MRRFIMLVAALALMLVAAAAPALAQGGNAHYVNEPAFSVEDTTVTAVGSLAGLGHWDVDLTLTVEASVSAQCRNRGGNIAPGQDKFFTDTAVQEGLEPKNGRVNFEISVTATPTEADLAAICPNPNWTTVNIVTTVHSATLEVSHGSTPQPHLTRTHP